MYGWASVQQTGTSLRMLAAPAFMTEILFAVNQNIFHSHFVQMAAVTTGGTGDTRSLELGTSSRSSGSFMWFMGLFLYRTVVMSILEMLPVCGV
ncbi:hypothetical protein BJ742DRAFT_188711 [Cladochytrium replicatum]|nr:hypothetical protein BJ742DRAFT_188711 [Cladochytrium replicatum]